MAFLAPRAPANAETTSARSTRGRAVPKGPNRTCLAAGSRGGARAGSWCTALWRVSMHGRAHAHVRRASPQCKVSGFAPGASRSFGASIGPLGTERVDLGRRWPKTFLLCPRSDNFFKNGTVSAMADHHRAHDPNLACWGALGHPPCKTRTRPVKKSEWPEGYFLTPSNRIGVKVLSLPHPWPWGHAERFF